MTLQLEISTKSIFVKYVDPARCLSYRPGDFPIASKYIAQKMSLKKGTQKTETQIPSNIFYVGIHYWRLRLILTDEGHVYIFFVQSTSKFMNLSKSKSFSEKFINIDFFLVEYFKHLFYLAIWVRWWPSVEIGWANEWLSEWVARRHKGLFFNGPYIFLGA